MVYLISPSLNFNYVVFVKLNTIGKTKANLSFTYLQHHHTQNALSKEGLLLSKNSKLGGQPTEPTG